MLKSPESKLTLKGLFRFISPTKLENLKCFKEVKSKLISLRSIFEKKLLKPSAAYVTPPCNSEIILPKFTFGIFPVNRGCDCSLSGLSLLFPKTKSWDSDMGNPPSEVVMKIFAFFVELLWREPDIDPPTSVMARLAEFWWRWRSIEATSWPMNLISQIRCSKK